MDRSRVTSSSSGYAHIPSYLTQPPPQHHPNPTSPTTSLLYAFTILYLLLLYFNYPLPTPHTLLLELLTHLIPTRLLFLRDRAQRQELQDLRAKGMQAQAHAVKKEVLRGVLGFGASNFMATLPVGTGEGMGGIVRRASLSLAIFARGEADKKADATPPGLGNWDNSCYQNCVLQGLASLDALQPYLVTLLRPKTRETSADEAEEEGNEEQGEETTGGSLLQTLRRLNDERNNGKLLWTPKRLKRMSSWQQQDAQEYLSKILEEVEKEAGKAFAAAASFSSNQSSSRNTGLAELIPEGNEQPSSPPPPSLPANTPPPLPIMKNPLDGLLSQKVTCTTCAYTEGLSLIPFNCLTLPLPLPPTTSYTLPSSPYSQSTPISACLDAYTRSEDIPGVECGKCTLLRARGRLEALLRPAAAAAANAMDGTSTTASPSNDSECTPQADTKGEKGAGANAEAETKAEKVLQLPADLRAAAFQRLGNITTALDTDDFSDKTLTDLCRIGKKGRVCATKTRQARLARLPSCLCLHVNRSLFDESTGVLRKNYGRVTFPLRLDLSQRGWVEECAARKEGDGGGKGEMVYVLKAVITHFGRHENGHYICYRRHPGVRRAVDDHHQRGLLPDGVEAWSEDATAAVEEEKAREEQEKAREEQEKDQEEQDEDKRRQQQWWRLSDENVSPVDEEDVLGQGGVFMLFYEREQFPPLPLPRPQRGDVVGRRSVAGDVETREALATRIHDKKGEQEEILARQLAEDAEPATSVNPVAERSTDSSPPPHHPHQLHDGEEQAVSPSPSASPLSDLTPHALSQGNSPPLSEQPVSPETTTAEDAPSVSTSVEDEEEGDRNVDRAAPDPSSKFSGSTANSTSPLRMRTARFREEADVERERFDGSAGGGFRPVAAT